MRFRQSAENLDGVLFFGLRVSVALTLVELTSVVKERGKATGGGVEAFGAAEMFGDHSGSAEVIPQAVGGFVALIGCFFLAADVVPQGVLDGTDDACGFRSVFTHARVAFPRGKANDSTRTKAAWR